MNPDGSEQTNLTNTPDVIETDPAWSPDGGRIAFAGVRQERTADPVTGEPVPAAQWEIVTVNPDGTGELVLTSGDPGTERALRLEEDRAPEWSPDGSAIVVMSQSVDPCCPPWQIGQVGRDGTGATLLSDNPAVNDRAPSFSPDGTWDAAFADLCERTGRNSVWPRLLERVRGRHGRRAHCGSPAGRAVCGVGRRVHRRAADLLVRMDAVKAVSAAFRRR